MYVQRVSAPCRKQGGFFPERRVLPPFPRTRASPPQKIFATRRLPVPSDASAPAIHPEIFAEPESRREFRPLALPQGRSPPRDLRLTAAIQQCPRATAIPHQKFQTQLRAPQPSRPQRSVLLQRHLQSSQHFGAPLSGLECGSSRQVFLLPARSASEAQDAQCWERLRCDSQKFQAPCSLWRH